MSTKTRPFSIFLLKQGYDASNSLKEENSLSEAVVSSKLPEDASLFILDNPSRNPWWKDYFEIAQPLLQASKGALVFLPVQDRCFVLSFGHVFHSLKDNCYEYDFGLRVTLNSLDPNKLKSADVMDPGASRRKRTQVPAATDLTFLDFDSNAEIIRSLTGAVKEEFVELFKSATGSASLKVGLKIDPSELVGICESLLDLYSSEEYLVTFPNVGKITPEKDPDVVRVLDAQLLQKFIERSDDLSLSIPDIIDYRDNTCCRFQGRGGIADVYTDVSLEAFYEYLGDDYELGELSIERLKSFSIALCDAEGNISRAYSVYNCFLLDIVEPDKVFHICEGGWYRVDVGYIRELKNYLDAKCEDTDLVEYDHDVVLNGINHYSEENYNASVAQSLDRFICLDQTNMSPVGSSQIEPCDLYSVSVAEVANLYHIKISTRSSQLSHLFNQGVNSAELLILEAVCRDALKELIVDRIGSNDEREYCDPVDAKKLKVVYGVITRKNPAELSDNLPLFSKISLMRCFKSLELMQIPAALIYIPDVSPPKEKYSSYPTVIVEVFDRAKGKKEVCVVAGQALAAGAKLAGCCAVIKNSVAGSRFKVFYSFGKLGRAYTNHNWHYEVVV
ncbi:DUF6119 family protein [Pseudomonas sp. A-B-19]|uniref:DUF6119 family protein n=1 Tax=Pseudomonas sp. A-B-19 TaxID=2832405 RepID=UPI001CC1A76C|nr:TIGR04141 family sporadically distributed protein [Pseudomonas sp. A-B-19]